MAALVDAYAMNEIWTTWKTEARGANATPSKVPYAIDGRLAKANDPSTWMTYFEAEQAMKNFGHDGINIMLAPVDQHLHLGCIDLDACVGEEGDIAPWAADIVVKVNSYTEVSPSGTGLKVFFLHDPSVTLDPKHHWMKHVQKPNPKGGKALGIETFLQRHYQAITENLYQTYDSLRVVDVETLYAVQRVMAAFKEGDKPILMSEEDRLYSAIDSMENPGLSWLDWSAIGMAIHRSTRGSQRGYDAFLGWSQKSSKFNEADCRERWENWRRSPGDQVGEGTIFHHAIEAGWKDPNAGKRRPRQNGHDERYEEEPDGRPHFREQGRRKIREPGVAHIRPLADFIAEYKPLQFAVDDLLPKGQLTAFTAKTGDGKTTLAIYLAGHKANGLPFNKHDTPQGEVLYVLIENVIGAQHQMIAMRENWRSYCGKDFDETRFHVLTINAKMTVPEIAAAIRLYAADLGVDLDIIFVDTAPALFPGDEENDNVQQGDYARDLRRLTELPGGPAVVVLCHPSKAVMRAVEVLPRGGSAFYFELDNNITLWRNDDTVEVAFTKLRMPPFEHFSFKLVPDEANKTLDAKGRPLRSVRLSPVSEDERAAAAERANSDTAKIITQMFQSTTLQWTSLKGIGVACGLILSETSEQHASSLRRTQRLISDLIKKDKLIEKLGPCYVLTKKGERYALGLGLSRDEPPKV